MAIERTAGNSLTAAEVLAYAERISRSRTDVGVNMCQRFVRSAFGSPGGAPTALAAWGNATYKHTKGTPPPGAAVYWGGGGAGHVAISAGNGMVYSTDVREPGKIDLVSMDYITNQWGKPLLGWSEDNNGIRINKFNAKPVAEGLGAKGSRYEPNYSTEAAGGGVATTLDRKALRQHYGHLAAIYDTVPEIKRLIDQATKGQWEPDEFEARLRASKWFRNHTEAERNWLKLEQTEPGEAKRQLEARRVEAQTLYRQLGVPVAPDRLDKIVRKSAVNGWTSQELRNAITAEFDYNPDNTFGGVAGQTVDEFRQMAGSYLVPLSNRTMEQWTENVLRGEATPDDFESYLKDQAKSLFPEIAPAIDRGQTVDQYLSPYRELAARELEMSPDDVDWTANKWSQAVFQTDEKGGRRIMGLADWQKALRSDKRFGWDATSGARDAASQFATEIATMFGKA